ncbi:MAG: hypothetical protein PVI91_00430 [Gammaproteobacteria bacterium]|jgi:hypothetical protein
MPKHDPTFCLRLLALLLSLTASAQAPAATDQDTSKDAAIRAALSRALAWIETHPATPADGGLGDMIDEAVAWRVFQQLARDPENRERFSRLFRSRMRELSQSAAFQRWSAQPHKPLIDHYHLVLAAHLMKRAGQASPLIRSIADQARRSLQGSFANPTVRLTTALFLSHLDDQTNIDIDALLAESLIEQLARDPQLVPIVGAEAGPSQRRRISWLLYALVHEVVALTDFGGLPPPVWLAGRREPVVAVLTEGILWARAQGNLDLLAELVVTVHFLGEPLPPQAHEGLETLLAEQDPDGSWGASSTTSRPDPVRHTVLTSTAALLAWLDWRTAPPRAPVSRPGRHGGALLGLVQRDLGKGNLPAVLGTRLHGTGPGAPTGQ